MTWIYAIGGIFLVALAFSISEKIGGLLVIILVLGMWLTAKQKGML